VTGRVSIIVRTMGRPELKRALASLATQTYRDIEIVLVVANPEYDPAAHASAPGVKIVAPGFALNRPNAGNAGLSAASGQWIGFLDEDDWLDPSHVANLVDALEHAGGPLLSYSDMIAHEVGHTVASSAGYWKRQYPDHPIIWIVSALFSRRLVDEFGCRFDAQFVLLEDWDFFVQCAEFSDCLHVHAATAHYDAHSGTSGGGSGINRDNARLKPYLELMTQKWGGKYAQLIARADEELDLADAAIRSQDFAAAQRHLEAGLAADPGNPHLLNRLALCRRQAGDWRGVLLALRRACDSDRNAFPMYCDLAQLEHRLGFPEKAKVALERLRVLAASDQERARVVAIAALLDGDRSPALRSA
jgi:hypothetical protein